jgi:hypothetical protein
LERDTARVLLKRYVGRSSEKLDPNQLALAWAAVAADLELITPPPESREEWPCCQLSTQQKE